MQQGQYIIVIFYEHSWDNSRERPPRLRYGFATLDSEGKTQVLSAPDFAHAHEPAARAAELIREWEAEVLRVGEELEQGHKNLAKRWAEAGAEWESDERELLDRNEPESLRLEVSCSEEVDELSGALSESGRLVLSP